MISDLVVSAVTDFLKASGRRELSSVNFYERDFGGDLAYPACVVSEDGMPEEDSIIRGQWTVPVSVVLRTIPEGDESSLVHRGMNQAITDLIGDDDAVIGFLSNFMQCNDCLGGQGTTEPSEGYRQTTFSVEIKAAESSDANVVPYLINPKTLNPYLLFYGTEGITTEGGNVEKWTQSAGEVAQLTRDLVQTTAEEQPLHDSSGGFLQFDAVDKQLDFSATAVAQAGILITATSNGIFAYEVDADSVATISALGSLTANFQSLGLYAYVLLPSSISDPQLGSVVRWIAANTGATNDSTGTMSNYWNGRGDLVAARGGTMNLSGATSLNSTWSGCGSLTSFAGGPVVLSSATSFIETWYNCTSLVTFPGMNLSKGTNFYRAWRDCSSITTLGECTFSSDPSDDINFSQTWYAMNALTSFPAMDLSRGTNFTTCWASNYAMVSFGSCTFSSDPGDSPSFNYSWSNCTALTSFPSDVEMKRGSTFLSAWLGCTALTSFPELDFSGATNLTQCWESCTSMTSFLSEDFSNCTNFAYTWRYCTALTSFPSDADLSKGSSFYATWFNCSVLNNFPALDLSDGIDFRYAWYNCDALTALPAGLDLSKGRNFSWAWQSCGALTTFPANFFDDWSPTSVDSSCFVETWGACSTLTATSVENILNSLATAGVAAPASNPDITIDYDATSGTPSVATAVGILKGLSPAWTITLNGTPQ